MFKHLRILFLFTVLIVVQSCSSSDDTSQEPEDVVVNLEFFNFTPQVDTTPENLQYEITFTNPNNKGVIGFYSVTTQATFGVETIESSILSTSNSVCYEIDANSSCVFSVDVTGDINIGAPDLIEFISASYRIDSTF